MSKERWKKKILSEIEARMAEFKKVLRDVIRINSDNPPGDTTKCADFLCNYLRSKRLPVEVYEPKPTNPNIVSFVKGETKGPNLILNGHIDQFPAEDAQDWSFDPYSGECSDGKILGRGSSDMKAGSICSLLCLQLVRELDIPIRGQLTLTLVSDEETGGKWGAKWLLDNVPATRGDSVLNGEPTGLDQIIIGHKGSCWFRVKTSDPGGHGALALGENAITKAMRVAQAIQKLQGLKFETSEEISDMIEMAKEQIEKTSWGKGQGSALESTTVNVGLVQGGTKVNVIPRSCELAIDIRIPFGATVQDFQSRIDEIVEQSGIHSDEISTEWILQNDPSFSSPKADIVQAVRSNAKAIVGKEPWITTWYALADSRYWQYLGIPVAVYGPTSFNMGAPDEYILEEEFGQVLKVHAATVIDYLCE